MDPQLIGDVFYSRLFQQMPSFKPMFKNSMTEQYAKIVDMLSLIVSLIILRQIEQRVMRYHSLPSAIYSMVFDRRIIK
jgi:hemoglobin-like flavoprotein